VHPTEQQRRGVATVSLSPAAAAEESAANKRRRLEPLERDPCPLGTGTWWTEISPEPIPGPPRGIKLAACAIPLDQVSSRLYIPAAQGRHERIPETSNTCTYCPVASEDRQPKVQSMLGALENPPDGHAVHSR
jgi:hypothetical protein